MALTPATIRFNRAQAASELTPRVLYAPADISIVQSAVNGWWPGERGMMEGVAAGSALPFKWKDYKNLQGFRPAIGSNVPIKAHDAIIDKDYLQLGYGGSLARRTNTLTAIYRASGGTGYAVGDILTLTGGVQLTVTSVSGGVISGTGFTISNYGTFTSRPTSVLAQTATTGSGTGATFMPVFATGCGSLELTPVPGIIPVDTNTFSVIAAFRCPVVGGVAGSDPGGFIVGAQLNQGEVYDPSANSRWWGLRLGAAQWGAGKIIGHVFGDNVVCVSGGTKDYRDGLWHVAMLTIRPGGDGTCRLWIDGTNDVGHVGGTFSSISTIAGNTALRIGGAGLPSGIPTGGAAMDVGEVLTVPLDLSQSANDVLRRTILNRMLQVWRLGGVSA